MPQQLDSIDLDVEARHAAQHALDRAHAAEGLLVAVAVEMRLAAVLVAQGEGGRAGGDVRRQELLEEERRRGERRDLGLRQEAQELVAEGVEAGRLEPDDAARRARRAATARRACAAPLRAPRRRGRPRGRCGRSTSGRPFGSARGAGGSPPRARTRSAAARFSRLEIAVEGVAEEDEVAAVARAPPRGRRAGPPRATAVFHVGIERRAREAQRRLARRGRRPGCGRAG